MPLLADKDADSVLLEPMINDLNNLLLMSSQVYQCSEITMKVRVVRNVNKYCASLKRHVQFLYIKNFALFVHLTGIVRQYEIAGVHFIMVSERTYNY